MALASEYSGSWFRSINLAAIADMLDTLDINHRAERALRRRLVEYLDQTNRRLRTHFNISKPQELKWLQKSNYAVSKQQPIARHKEPGIKRGSHAAAVAFCNAQLAGWSKNAQILACRQMAFVANNTNTAFASAVAIMEKQMRTAASPHWHEWTASDGWLSTHSLEDAVSLPLPRALHRIKVLYASTTASRLMNDPKQSMQFKQSIQVRQSRRTKDGRQAALVPLGKNIATESPVR